MTVVAPCSNPGRRRVRRRKLQIPAPAGIPARHGANGLRKVARLWAQRTPGGRPPGTIPISRPVPIHRNPSVHWFQRKLQA